MGEFEEGVPHGLGAFYLNGKLIPNTAGRYEHGQVLKKLNFDWLANSNLFVCLCVLIRFLFILSMFLLLISKLIEQHTDVPSRPPKVYWKTSVF